MTSFKHEKTEFETKLSLRGFIELHQKGTPILININHIVLVTEGNLVHTSYDNNSSDSNYSFFNPDETLDEIRAMIRAAQ